MSKKIRRFLNLVLVVSIFIATLYGALAEQTVKTVEVPLPYNSVAQNGDLYSNTINVQSPDGIETIISMEFIIKGDFQASTNLYNRVRKYGSSNMISCSPYTWTMPPVDVTNYEASVDCSSVVSATGFDGGKIDFLYQVDKTAVNIKPKIKITYYNEPKARIKVHGTQYNADDNGKLFVQLLDENNYPINDSLCFVTLYYPIGGSDDTYFREQRMTYKREGLYYYDFNTPYRNGIYMASSYCIVGSEQVNTTTVTDNLDNFSLYGKDFNFFKENGDNLTSIVKYNDGVIEEVNMDKVDKASYITTTGMNFSNGTQIIMEAYPKDSDSAKTYYIHNIDGTEIYGYLNFSGTTEDVYYNISSNYLYNIPSGGVDTLYISDLNQGGKAELGIDYINITVLNKSYGSAKYWDFDTAILDSNVKYNGEYSLKIDNKDNPVRYFNSSPEYHSFDVIYRRKIDSLEVGESFEVYLVDASGDYYQLETYDSSEDGGLWYQSSKTLSVEDGVNLNGTLKLSMRGVDTDNSDYLYIDDIRVNFREDFSINQSEYQVVRGSGEVQVQSDKLYTERFTGAELYNQTFFEYTHLHYEITSRTAKNVSDNEISLETYYGFPCRYVDSVGVYDENHILIENVSDFEVRNYNSNKCQVTFPLDLSPDRIYDVAIKVRNYWKQEILSDYQDALLVKDFLDIACINYQRFRNLSNFTVPLETVPEYEGEFHRACYSFYNSFYEYNLTLNDTFLPLLYISRNFTVKEMNSLEADLIHLERIGEETRKYGDTIIQGLNLGNSYSQAILNDPYAPENPDYANYFANISASNVNYNEILKLSNNVSKDLEKIELILEDINYTVDNIDNFLNNTLYPEVDEVEEKLDDVLSNQTFTQSRLDDIQNNVTANYNELQAVKLLIDNINNSVISQIDENEQILLDINLTITALKNYVELNLTNYVDEVELKLADVLNNQSNVYSKLLDIQNNVTNTYNNVKEVNDNIKNINTSLTVEINENEAKLDVIDSVVDLILEEIQNNVTFRLESILNDTSEIISYVDSLETGQQNIINITGSNFSEIRNNISQLSNKLDNVESSIKDSISNVNNTLYNQSETNYISLSDQINSNISNIRSILYDIENRLDCNYTNNEICDRIRELNSSLNYMNNTNNNIYDYLTNNITFTLEYQNSVLDRINGTITDVYSYLQNTIYPEIDETEEKIDLVFQNQSKIYSKILDIEDDVQTNYNEIQSLKLMLNSINSSIINEINENEAKLDEINNITIEIKDLIENNLIPKVENIDSNVTYIRTEVDTIRGMVDTLEPGQQQILANLSAIDSNLSLISSQISNLRANMTSELNEVDNSLQNLDYEVGTIQDRLDCNHTTNEICNRLDNIKNSIVSVNQSVNKVDSYLKVNISNDLIDIYSVVHDANQTVSFISSYLNGTIYPAVDDVENNLLNVLSNQTITHNKLDSALSNLSNNYAKMQYIENLLLSMNLTLSEKIENKSNLIISEINQNEEKIDIINNTVNLILSNQNNTISTNLSKIYSVIVDTNTTVNGIDSYLKNDIKNELDYIKIKLNESLVNTSNIYNEIINLQSNVSDNYDELIIIKGMIRNVNSTLVKEINSTRQDIIVLNNTLNSLDSYVRNNLQDDIDYLIELSEATNLTVNGIQSYLNDTIYPEIDETEERLDSVLTNTSNIWDKLIEVQNNVSQNNAKLEIVKNLLNDVNQSIITEINENEAKLDVLQSTAEVILNKINDTIIVSIENMQDDIDVIRNNTDDLIDGQNGLSLDIANLSQKISQINVSNSQKLDEIHNDIYKIQDRLDCNHTSNVICSKLDDLDLKIDALNTTTVSYLKDIYTLVDTINITTKGINDYVRQNVTSSLEEIESRLISLNGTSYQILGEVQSISSNVSDIKVELDFLESLVVSMNTSLHTEINQNQVKLDLISDSVDDVYSKLNDSIEPKIEENSVKIDNMINNISIMRDDLETLKANSTHMIHQLEELNQSLYSLFDTQNQTLDQRFSYIESLIDSLNVSLGNLSLYCNGTDFCERFDNLEDNLSLINGNVLSIKGTIDSTVIDYLDDINATVAGIYGDTQYIRNSVDSISSDTTEILDKWGNYSASQIIENLTLTQNKIDSVQTWLYAFNATEETRYLNMQSSIQNVDNRLNDINLSIVQIIEDLGYTGKTTTVYSDLSNLSQDLFWLNISLYDLEDNLNKTINHNHNETVVYLDSINDTLGEIEYDVNDTTSIINDIKNSLVTEVTDVDRVVATKYYETEVTVRNQDGTPIVLNNSPTIVLKDSLNNTIVSGDSLNKEKDGVYTYRYKTGSSSATGNWRAEYKFEYNNQTVYVYDRFNLISNPTQIKVDVQSFCGEEVCAEITIQNEGVTPYEYIFYYWTTPKNLEDLDGSSVADSGQASKLIKPGEVYKTTKCLSAPSNTGKRFFRSKVYYGEYSYATDSFDRNTPCPSKGGLTGWVIGGEEIKPSPRQIIPGIPNLVSYAGLFTIILFMMILIIGSRRG